MTVVEGAADPQRCTHEVERWPPAVYRLAAGSVVTAHLGYIGFLLAGGFFGRRRRRVLALHASAMAATAVIFLGRLDCPLTDLERQLRRRGGQDCYDGGFVAHYLVEPCRVGRLTGAVHLVMPGAFLALTAEAYRRALRPAPARVTTVHP